MLLTARARVHQAERSRSEPERRSGAGGGRSSRLDRAEKLDPSPSQALYADRALYHGALGDAQAAARKDRARRDATPIRAPGATST